MQRPRDTGLTVAISAFPRKGSLESELGVSKWQACPGGLGGAVGSAMANSRSGS